MDGEVAGHGEEEVDYDDEQKLPATGRPILAWGLHPVILICWFHYIMSESLLAKPD